MAKSPATSKKRQSSAPKTSAGKVAAKTNVRKSAKNTAPRDSLKTLRDHVERISIRLERADRLTSQGVQALQTSFAILERRVEERTNSSPGALAQKVEALSARLNRTVDETRRAVKQDMKSLLNGTDPDRIEAAAQKAEGRLAQLELVQADALAKINLQIADMAKIIDGRLKKQTSDRDQALNTISARLSQRIDEIESDSAASIQQVGDKMVSVSTELQARLEQQSDFLGRKISEIAEKTQQDAKANQHLLGRRMDMIEESQRNLDASNDRSIASLAARIDSLEYGLSVTEQTVETRSELDAFNAPKDATPKDATPKNAAPAEAPPNPYQSITPVPAPAPVSEGEHTAPQTSLPESSILESSILENSITEPYKAKTPQTDMPVPAPVPPAHVQAPHMPSPGPLSSDLPPGSLAQPYDPAQHAPAPITDPYALHPQDQNYTQAQTLPGADIYEFSPQSVALEELSDSDLPYANPAYAETDPDTGLSRPGQMDKKKKKKPRKTRAKKAKANPDLGTAKNSIITGRNLRVAGLAASLAALGYFGLRGYFQPSSAPNSVPNGTSVIQTSPTSSAPVNIPANATNANNLTITAPIGNYPDNGAMIASGSAEPNTNPSAQTLEAAALSGDPVAQFQLGIIYMDAGRKQDAIKNIRAAANQGLPAAQFQLAKLYEAGVGVGADPDMARQLSERAARQGNRIAMHDLALYYAEGRGGVALDVTKAAEWFEGAAKRGVVDSQFNLGVLYESGQGVGQDLSKAYEWYSIAARQGDQLAQERIGVLNSQLSSDELKAAKKRSEKFKPAPIDEAANGIFKNVTWKMPNRKTIKPSAELVRDAQVLLTQIGYDSGGIDGSIGPKTRAAIISFQRASGLPETGQINAQLIDRLQVASGA